ncbi:hypothetical protein [Azohydromonas lata]|uniref:hypothetical protein n=1 Tax=Azohydromonas lata TaxID=45677 RepID=UPI00083101D1|nr:hypothetical protein [Azohydromonas lata]
MAALELAAAMVPFMVLVLALPEFCKLAWAWNAASEATLLGARKAAVCGLNSAAIKTRMREVMPWLQDDNIVIAYERPGATSCTASGATACRVVQVSLSGYQQTVALPMLPALTVPLPSFTTSLPREFMDSSC